jgi:hypothetical protein
MITIRNFFLFACIGIFTYGCATTPKKPTVFDIPPIQIDSIQQYEKKNAKELFPDLSNEGKNVLEGVSPIVLPDGRTGVFFTEDQLRFIVELAENRKYLQEQGKNLTQSYNTLVDILMATQLKVILLQNNLEMMRSIAVSEATMKEEYRSDAQFEKFRSVLTSIISLLGLAILAL